MVIVAVELAGGTVFHCYLEVLRRCSSFFRVCFDSGFEESYTLTVRLEDHALCSVFHLFSDWSLHREIRNLRADTGYAHDSDQDNTEVIQSFNTSTWIELVNLWLLGDYLGAPKLQNDVIDALSERAHLIVSDESPFLIAQRVWNRTRPSSHLRGFFMELLTNPNYFGSPSLYARRLDLLSTEVVVGLADYISSRLKYLHDMERSDLEAHHCNTHSPHALEEESRATIDQVRLDAIYRPILASLSGAPQLPGPSQQIHTPDTSEPPNDDESMSDTSAQAQ